jgi:hypothetical protein
LGPVSNGRFDADEVNDSGIEEMEVEENCQQPKYTLKPCLESHLKARHGLKGDTKRWKTMTPGYIIALFGTICIIGVTRR